MELQDTPSLDPSVIILSIQGSRDLASSAMKKGRIVEAMYLVERRKRGK